MEETYDKIKSIKAQEEYCEKHSVPHFAPYDGTCKSCWQDIYSGKYGYTVEHAASSHITSCPYCRASFCN